jgi:hypothetical protein
MFGMERNAAIKGYYSQLSFRLSDRTDGQTDIHTPRKRYASFPKIIVGYSKKDVQFV